MVQQPAPVQAVHVKGKRFVASTKLNARPSHPDTTLTPHLPTFYAGQEPLTSSMLAAAQPAEQKQMLGERLFPIIESMYPQLAGKITGMLLEIDNSELLHMLEHNDSLKNKVDEAVAVLQAHQAKQAVTSTGKME